jgi:small subunit ribosomal protein S17
MRTKKGTVTSIKMDKTIVVSVNTYKEHPKYKKSYKVTNKYYAHDEQNTCND